MLGLFLWVLVFLLASLESVAEDQNVESCFLYPVNEGKSSPAYKITGNGEHFVTVNRIFREGNFVQILDQQDDIVVDLREGSSSKKSCSFNFLTNDNYTTLVFRRQDDKLTVHKRNSLEKECDISKPTETLTVKSNEMVNIAFNCPGSCYSFENTTLHATLKKGDLSFPIYGRIKESADNKILKLSVMKGKHDSVKFEVEGQNSDSNSDDWFSLQFKTTLGPYVNGSPGHYPLTLTVDSPWKIKGDKSSTLVNLPTEDLYLNFNGTTNVKWAATCKPDRGAWSALVPENACSLYRDLSVGILVVVAVLAIILLVMARLLHKLWNQEVVTSPSPGIVGARITYNADPESHDYEYIELTEAGQQVEEDRYHTRNGLVNQPRSPAANINNSAFDYATEFQVRVGDLTRQKLSVNGDARLVVESDVLLITLISSEGRRIARWTLEQLRRFGYSDNEFNFEAGRKSVHGVGVFNFITTQGKRIHNLLQRQVDSRITREETGCQAHFQPPSGQTLGDNDDGYEIPLTFSNDDGGYVSPRTFSNNDNGSEISPASDEHTYEEIPGIPNNRVSIII
ncbi:uncharacterized protein [Macrobrachium rosenbergii]|uniref:uncharacterized protein isoform X2 n=2 Tax=Macrobrachium rosenbergii TaxID=79674 RepID=UPI0034D781F9